MKKRLLVMAMAGVALAGCVSDEVAEVVQKNEQVKITFDSPIMYNKAESRANVHGEIGSYTYEGTTATYSYPRAEDFKIYAVSHTGNLTTWATAEVAEFNGNSLSYDDNVDGWAPKQVDDPTTSDVNEAGKYYVWPSGKKMSFAASSPAELENDEITRSYGSAGLTISNFQVASDAANHYDLMYSHRTVNKTSADMDHGASYYSGIPIVFRHALSSIRFSISNQTFPDHEIVLTGITLKGDIIKGSFAENLDENSTHTDQNGVLHYSVNPTWTLTDVRNTTGYTAFSGSVVAKKEPQYVAALAAAANTNTCNQLLLLPQDLTENIVVEISYTIDGESHTKTVTLADLKNLNDDSINEWEMGYRYTYRLVYTEETVSKDLIYFSPSSDGWLEDEENGVIVVNLQ